MPLALVLARIHCSPLPSMTPRNEEAVPGS